MTIQTKDKCLSYPAQKGGVGKTTESTNTAAEAARLGARVLLIDMDPSCAATSLLLRGQGPAEDEPSLSHVIAPDTADRVDPRQAIRSVVDEWQPDSTIPWQHGGALIPGQGRLDVLPSDVGAQANAEASSFKRRMANALHKPARSGETPVVEDYDVVIFDCQPTTGMLTQLALMSSSWFSLVTQAEPLSAKAVVLASDFVQYFCMEEEHDLAPAGVIINDVDARVKEQARSADDIRAWVSESLPKSDVPGQEHLGTVWEPPIPGRTLVAESQARAVPISYELRRWPQASRLKQLDFPRRIAPFVALYTQHALHMLRLLAPECAGTASQALEATEMCDQVREVLLGSEGTGIEADDREAISQAREQATEVMENKETANA